MTLKLFGGNRGGAHSKETVMDAVTDEVGNRRS